ncbi:hypothetical protein [Arthrobacter sp. ISL-30]|uniref:hypothetical protein n=1 Tax=Arthrobacter sp. ISL-30 TaxID=2819109 RepID=UPI002035D362|nr:hypothetical protein [Arthrobacter sp. ISL-30]
MDGLAIFSKSVPAYVLKLIARRIPVVEIAEPPHGDALNHITVDNAGGMRELTQHLLHDHKLTRLQFPGPGDFTVSSDTTVTDHSESANGAGRPFGGKNPHRQVHQPGEAP